MNLRFMVTLVRTVLRQVQQRAANTQNQKTLEFARLVDLQDSNNSSFVADS